MDIKLVIVLLGAAASLFLFYKASSTLNIAKINVVSYICYLFFIQTYIGASIAYLGDLKHYTFNYVIDIDHVNVMFYCVLLTGILLPGVMVLLYKLFRVNIKECYEGYLKRPAELYFEKPAFFIVSGLSAFCLLLLVIFLAKIGYIPLFRLIKPPAGYNFGTERIRITNANVVNNYIKNVMILSFIPLLSYIAFTFAITVKKMRWVILTVVMVLASVIVKTYNFEKSPIMFYGFVFLFIWLYAKGRLSNKLTVSCLVLAGAVMIFMYGRMNYSVDLSHIDIYNGPFGRTIFTQVGTLTYHFDLFPQIFPFLDGRSFPKLILKLFHLGDSQLRSAKLVMDYYGAKHVFEGTGGVMNAFFIGEAYANFGFAGMTAGIVYLGALVAFVYRLFLKIEKNPLSIALFAVMTSKIALATQSGFVDFIYNADALFTVLLVVAVLYLSRYLTKRGGLKSAVKAK